MKKNIIALFSVNVQENLKDIIKYHVTEYYGKVCNHCVKISEKYIYLVHRDNLEPIYRIDRETKEIDVVYKNPIPIQHTVKKYMEQWVEETKDAFFEELRILHNKYYPAIVVTKVPSMK